MHDSFSLPRRAWESWFASVGSADLNLLLFAVWDPIRVNDTAIAATEYVGYVGEVFAFVPDRDVRGLAACLLEIASRRMGLSRSELPLEEARRVIDGAPASAWLWAGSPLP